MWEPWPIVTTLMVAGEDRENAGVKHAEVITARLVQDERVIELPGLFPQRMTPVSLCFVLRMPSAEGHAARRRTTGAILSISGSFHVK
jgi:hypothetical protein